MIRNGHMRLVVLGLVLSLSLSVGIQYPYHTPNADADVGGSPDNDLYHGVDQDKIHPGEGAFIENRGQVSSHEVRFITEMGRVTVGFMDDAIAIVQLPGTIPTDDVLSELIDPVMNQWNEHVEGESHTVIMGFVECNRIRPCGVNDCGAPRNFFIGNDPVRWVLGASSYEEIRYTDIWDGVDLVFYFYNGYLKYDCQLKAGANPSLISFQYDGAANIKVDDETGELIISTPVGDIRDLRPVVFQDGLANGMGDAEFIILGENRIGFSLPKEYSINQISVIDPGLVFSTYLGGTDDDDMNSLAVDQDENIFITGMTLSTDIPTTPGSFCATVGRGFIEKFDSTGSNLLYATYFGGVTRNTVGESISVMPDGRIVVSGETESPFFPTTESAFQRNNRGHADAFILVLDSSGSSLVYGSYFGGSGNETGDIHRFDSQGGLVLVGATDSDDLKVTTGAYCTTFNKGAGTDVFLARFDNILSNITRCTYLGGSDSDIPDDIDLMDDMSLVLVGKTTSTDFPVNSGAFCTTYKGHGEIDCFILRMNSNWSTLEYSTYLGGDGLDESIMVGNLSNGTTLVLGLTRSRNYPITPGAPQKTRMGLGDAFVTLLNDDGSQLLYSSYWGGGKTDSFLCGAWNQDRTMVTLGGQTDSTDLDTSPGCYNPKYTGGGTDAFIVGFNLANLQQYYCTYIGGSTPGTTSSERIRACIFDGTNVIAIGSTTSDDFPTTTGAYRRTQYSTIGSDGFVLKLDTRPVSLPDAPRNLRVIPNNGWAEINWDASIAENYVVTDYMIYRGEESGKESLLIEIPRTSSYIDNGLTNGKRYYYRLSAVNSMGEGALSDEVGTMPLGPPTQPLNLSATTGNGTVMLSWDPPTSDGGSEVLGYIVGRGWTTPDLTTIATIGNITAYLDTKAIVGDIFYYGVTAFNSKGNGIGSSTVRLRVTDLPYMPRDFATVPGNGRVDISWREPVYTGGIPLLGYRLYRGVTPESLSYCATVGPLVLSFADTMLQNGHRYYYQMTAFNDVGEGPPTLSLEAIPFTLPGRSMNLRAQAGDGYVYLQWDPPDSDGGRQILRYNIFSGVESGKLSKLTTIGNINYFNNTLLANGETYYYQVQAITEAGEGPFSAEVSARPLGPPGIPGRIDAVSLNGKVMLSWREPTDFGGADRVNYTILKGNSPDNIDIFVVGITSLSYQDDQVSVGSTYYYAIHAVNSMGAGESTSAIMVHVLSIPSEVINPSAIPGDGMVHLQWSIPEDNGGSPITGYIIYRGLVETGLAELVHLETTLNYTDTTVTNGKRYFYNIVAVNDLGNGPQTRLIDATPLSIPDPPTSLNAEIRGTSVILIWVPPPFSGKAPVTGYVVHRGTSREDLHPLANIGDNLTFVDTDIEKGKTYYYSIQAISQVGLSELGPIIEVKVKKEENGSPAFNGTITIGSLMLMTAFSCYYMRSKRNMI